MTFHMPDSYYDPPDLFECDECEDALGCTCEEDALTAWEDAQIDAEDARRKERD